MNILYHTSKIKDVDKHQQQQQQQLSKQEKMDIAIEQLYKQFKLEEKAKKKLAISVAEEKRLRKMNANWQKMTATINLQKDKLEAEALMDIAASKLVTQTIIQQSFDKGMKRSMSPPAPSPAPSPVPAPSPPLAPRVLSDQEFYQFHGVQFYLAHEMLCYLKAIGELNSVLYPVSMKKQFEKDEFLGDSQLDLYIATKLNELPDASPGKSTKRRIRGVKNDTLTLFFLMVRLSEIMNEQAIPKERHPGKEKADAFEVLICELSKSQHAVAKVLLNLLVKLIYVYAIQQTYKSDDITLEAELKVALTMVRQKKPATPATVTATPSVAATVKVPAPAPVVQQVPVARRESNPSTQQMEYNETLYRLLYF
ncbi:hypothetical protein SAMD00019534_082250 [Acytostelium subglobosum LB1]|uniref:hypothetical protein n=1 Tax=Acytostelium subglobosum LB1 TaxID=1410327 RepID=UPI00064491EC|nr:hypothetical protein SAMD00019534_082250 [Acytostelium subglobosum LB1]GAM25050.1 hypothetical protein SAMD00019534_082250 [Acytostelium subglobosum LB1]|eukprot:XP_012752139.1 hypothetical protein SAMD00019534_082250 [Acytostelium subglobosum LB1]